MSKKSLYERLEWYEIIHISTQKPDIALMGEILNMISNASKMAEALKEVDRHGVMVTNRTLNLVEQALNEWNTNQKEMA